MRRDRLKALGLSSFLFLYLVLLLSLQVPVVEAATYDYDLAGAYNEQGVRDGAINCTIYRSDNSSYTFELDGTHNITESAQAIAFKFDLGYNETRTYYLTNETSENILVIKPPEPYYSYYFAVVDYVGVDDAFLETLINVNGSDRVVERWSLEVLNELPFTLNWGAAYKLRLVCDLGVYYYPNFVAGATTSNIIAITEDMFPSTLTDISDIVVSAERVNVTWIQSIYNDGDNQTSWIYMAVYELNNSTILDSVNITDHSYYLQWNWYGADNETSYYVRIQVLHDVRGNLIWTRVCPLPYSPSNPWSDLSTILGTNFPIDVTQIFGIGIVLLIAGTFSRQNIGVGLVVTVLMAAILVYIGWLSIGWTWITMALAISIIVALSIHKGDEKI